MRTTVEHTGAARREKERARGLWRAIVLALAVCLCSCGPSEDAPALVQPDFAFPPPPPPPSASRPLGPGTIETIAMERDAPPTDVALDATGNLYIAYLYESYIRRVDVATGVVSTVAGTDEAGFGGDGGPAAEARLYMPSGVAVDSTGDLYIADTHNNCVRRVDAATGVISTIVGKPVSRPEGRGELFCWPGDEGDGGPATEAQRDSPRGVALDADGNLYIADTGNHRIRRVDAATGVISTVAGIGPRGQSISPEENEADLRGDGGPATEAWIRTADDVAVDAAGNLYIASSWGHRVRRVDAATGVISTVAGTGVDGCAGALGLSGSARGLTEFEEGCAGDGGPATEALLDAPTGVAVDAAGNLYIADTNHDRVRRVAAPE